jgi:predicted metallopeptidase
MTLRPQRTLAHQTARPLHTNTTTRAPLARISQGSVSRSTASHHGHTRHLCRRTHHPQTNSLRCNTRNGFCANSVPLHSRHAVNHITQVRGTSVKSGDTHTHIFRRHWFLTQWTYHEQSVVAGAAVRLLVHTEKRFISADRIVAVIAAEVVHMPHLPHQSPRLLCHTVLS